MRLAVEVGDFALLYAIRLNRDSLGIGVDEALFRSRLARLKSTLDYERELLTSTGESEGEPASDDLIEELVELGRRAISKELVKEFEAVLAESDKLYQNIQKSRLKESQQRKTDQTQNPLSYAHLHPADRQM